MFSYFFKRLFQSILVMIVVAFVSFSLFNFVGDPVNSMTGEDASDERDRIAESMTPEQIDEAQKLSREWFEKYQPKE